jgi:LmbE family N-acetylglucosaminyl deacetylase
VGAILAVGAHIGDMDLTAGPVLADAALAGHRVVLLALTPGERGHPRLDVERYREQKLAEGHAFAAAIGAELRVLGYSDGFLEASPRVCAEVAAVIREVRPEVLIAHWGRSIHADHAAASAVAVRARLWASLPLRPEEPGGDLPRHGVRRLLYTENWEDAEGFVPDVYVPVSARAFEIWRAAIEGQAFARGETYGFRYIDYYTAQLTMRGCLARTERAVAFAEHRDAPRTISNLVDDGAAGEPLQRTSADGAAIGGG